MKVNGEIVTKTEFERIQIAAFREMPNQPDPGEDHRCRAREGARADNAAGHRDGDRRDVAASAREGAGFAVSDEQFTEVIASIKKDNKLESDEQFQAALKSEGITLAQLKQMLSKRMLIGQVQRREISSRST